MTIPHLANLGVLPPARLRVVGLAAARTGTTDTAILNFSGTPAVVGTAIAAASTAAAGTLFTLRERGIYHAMLTVQGDATDGVAFGISLGATASLNAIPALGNSGILVAGLYTPAAGTVTLSTISWVFEVTAAQAAAGTSIARFHATIDGAATAPTPLSLTACVAQIIRVADWAA